jgi:hypothetical protein
VNYVPSDDTPDNGKITLTTNVADKGSFEIDIGTSAVAPEISVSPGAYDFGRVTPIPAGSDDPVPFVDVTVSNIGQLALEDLKITLSGSQEFVPTIGGRDPRRADNAGLLDDPDGDDSTRPRPGPELRDPRRIQPRHAGAGRGAARHREQRPRSSPQ